MTLTLVPTGISTCNLKGAIQETKTLPTTSGPKEARPHQQAPEVQPCGLWLWFGKVGRKKAWNSRGRTPYRQQTYLTAILAFHSLVNLGNFFIWILQKLKTNKNSQSTMGPHGATQRQKPQEKRGVKFVRF